MREHRRRILDLLAAGKITAEEAEKLLAALPADPEPNNAKTEQTTGQYFRIEVLKPGDRDGRQKKVNIRVPVSVLRSGLRLGSLLHGFKDSRWGVRDRLSDHLRARGLNIDFDHLDPAELESLLTQVGDVTIDVDDGRAQIRVVRE